MARRNVQFVRGTYYHVYNRGCNRENIFRSEENYEFLLRTLKDKTSEFDVTIIAYCLMPNHYHFLLRQDGEKSAGTMIQFVFNSYTKAFNAMYKRSGTLFEGSFKSIHIDKHSYLIHVCRYIHRNPLEAGLVSQLENWKYSNYLEWIGKRKGALVDYEFVKAHFGSAEEYKQFVLEYVSPKMERIELEKFLLGK